MSKNIVFDQTLHAHKDFSISREKLLSMPAMRVCVPGAVYSFWRTNKFFFLVAWSRVLHFWRESKINSRCHWRCVLFRWVLSQQRERQIYWRLCNYSEIHFWLWQLWSMVVCSQSSFHVTRTRKDDTNRQNTLFCYTTNNFSKKSHFNQTNIKRKNCVCVWTTKCVRLSEMCIVPHVETKSVFTFQPIKRLVSTSVKSAKPAATFWIFLLRIKSLQLICLAVMEHIVYTNRDYEKEKPSPFSVKFLRQSQPSTSEPEPKKVKRSPNTE